MRRSASATGGERMKVLHHGCHNENQHKKASAEEHDRRKHGGFQSMNFLKSGGDFWFSTNYDENKNNTLAINGWLFQVVCLMMLRASLADSSDNK